jgi:hypothetical protein
MRWEKMESITKVRSEVGARYISPVEGKTTNQHDVKNDATGPQINGFAELGHRGVQHLGSQIGESAKLGALLSSQVV